MKFFREIYKSMTIFSAVIGGALTNTMITPTREKEIVVKERTTEEPAPVRVRWYEILLAMAVTVVVGIGLAYGTVLILEKIGVMYNLVKEGLVEIGNLAKAMIDAVSNLISVALDTLYKSILKGSEKVAEVAEKIITGVQKGIESIAKAFRSIKNLIDYFADSIRAMIRNVFMQENKKRRKETETIYKYYRQPHDHRRTILDIMMREEHRKKAREIELRTRWEGRPRAQSMDRVLEDRDAPFYVEAENLRRSSTQPGGLEEPLFGSSEYRYGTSSSGEVPRVRRRYTASSSRSGGSRSYRGTEHN